jgi:hypothetical protein
VETSRTLVLLGKPGCHLCDEMRAVVEPLLRARGLVLVEKDVRDDRELEQRYLFEIPVLLLETREVARHRVTEHELRERLASLGLSGTE